MSIIQYSRVRVSNIKDEIRMISELRKIGSPFRAVSTTDYIVSSKQCKILKSKKIPYQVIK